MRIFALETDTRKIVERYCGKGECVLNITHYHGMSLTINIIKEVLLTIVIIGIVSAMAYFGLPLFGAIGLGVLIFFLFVFLPFTKAWIDWKYDFMFTTSDKIVLVDQSSFFKQHIKPIHFENIGSIGMETQWFNIFNFGKIQIDLKEGEGGGKIVQKFVPNAQKVAEIMSGAVTSFQRGSYRNTPIELPTTERPYISNEEVHERLQKINHTLEQVVKPQREERHEQQAKKM